MRRLMLLMLGLGLACEGVGDPDAGAIEPPDGTLVYEGDCARVYRSFEGEVCQGTLAALDRRACLIRDFLGAGATPSVEVYLSGAGSSSSLFDWCDGPVGGCARRNVAYAAPSAMNHEIVHAVAYSAVGHDQHSIISEGLAHVLDGTHNSLGVAPDLRALLESNTAENHRDQAANFVGWLLITRGASVVMEIARAVAPHAGRTELELALEVALGMNIDEIIDEYESSFAWVVPELPSVEPTTDMSALMAGVELTLDCDDGQTQGDSTQTWMWQSIDFRVDEDGWYTWPHGGLGLWISAVYEVPDYSVEEPAWAKLVGTLGSEEHRFYLKGARRYRVRAEASYPGPAAFTLRVVPDDS